MRESVAAHTSPAATPHSGSYAGENRTSPRGLGSRIDLAKIAAAERARAAQPFGTHDEDCERLCPCCVEQARGVCEKTQARYEYTQVVRIEDGGALLRAKTFTCGTCGSTYVGPCAPAAETDVLEQFIDRRGWQGREQSGIHSVARLSVPEDSGRYSLVGDLIDDSPTLLRSAS